MNVLCSLTAGVLLRTDGKSGPPVVSYLGEQEPWSEMEALHFLSLIDDWEVVETADERSIKQCVHDYWRQRAVSWIECLFQGLSEDLTLEVLGGVEELLQTRVSSDEVLSQLLVAPLREPLIAHQLANKALGAGVGAVAALLDKLKDYQPLLSRLVFAWLGLPVSAVADLSISREDLWFRLAKGGALPRLLSAGDGVAFRSAWNNALVFDEPSTAGKVTIGSLASMLADRLHPTSSIRVSVPQSEYLSESSSDEYLGEQQGDRPRKGGFGRDIHARVMKQINAIARSVAEGHDQKAARFLRELIEEQRNSSSSNQVLMSLCNIAKRCADMYRFDFERLCLQEALRVGAGDPWTLIQWGDHLKRVGAFDDAIAELRKAVVHGHEAVALGSIASVYCERGDYRKAVETYKSIPQWQSEVTVCTGLADILRHQGQFDDALREYDQVLSKWPGSDRAIAGKAEITRWVGQLDEAIKLYNSLIYSVDVDPHGKRIYRLQKCRLLKQANQLDEAYQMSDAIVREAPFFFPARVFRGSVLGLLDKELDGLNAIPSQKAQRGKGSWIQHYYRGLLLLKLRRYDAAREELVDRLEGAMSSGDDAAVLRLGAAFVFLYRNDFTKAEEILAGVGEVRDCYTRYVSKVLQMHVAVGKKDQQRAMEISRELESAEMHDSTLHLALAALKAGRLDEAGEFEIKLLLCAA